jgi:hypothetical protein
MPSADDDMRLQHVNYRQRVQAVFITLISLFSTLLSMASQDKGSKAYWTEDKTKALLAYLVDHKAEAGEGVNFQKKTYNGAAESLAAMRVKGGEKTGDACKRKWKHVSHRTDIPTVINS